MGGSECFGKGKYCRRLTGTQLAGLERGGLMTSRCSFLFAHGKMPEEHERGEDGGRRKTGEGVTAGESEQTHTWLTVREERGRDG